MSVQDARDEEREACAQLAEEYESPWARDHPREAWVSTLTGVIENALLGAWDRSDDGEPERTIAEAIYAWLHTGLAPIDRVLGLRPLSAAIRARKENDDG